MPYPPYHVGTNAFFGLSLRRWIDPAVIVLVNVVIDIEVLTATSYPDHHRHWHFHTFLVGGLIGAGVGLLCWFAKPLFKKIMSLVRINYEPRLWSMVAGGTLGMWIHVLIDSFDHYDVQPFWPYQRNPFWRILNHPPYSESDRDLLNIICLAFWVLAVILYIFAVKRFNKQKKGKSGDD